MRIDLLRTHPTPAADRAAGDATRSAGSPLSGQDRVSLSASLRLVKALHDVGPVDGDVRPEAIARGRALVASGEVDLDLPTLASLVLPDVLDLYDDDPR